MPHIEISSKEELNKLLAGTRHADPRDQMRGDTSRTCPHCGRGKQYRHGSGRFATWTPCDYPPCNATPYAKKIRQK